MTIKGCILNLIEKDYNGKLRTVVIIRIGTYVNKNQNNELAIFFNENKKHLLADFGVKDEVIITCTTLSFTNDNHRFYNYILGQSICFDVSHFLSTGNSSLSLAVLPCMWLSLEWIQIGSSNP